MDHDGDGQEPFSFASFLFQAPVRRRRQQQAEAKRARGVTYSPQMGMRQEQHWKRQPHAFVSSNLSCSVSPSRSPSPFPSLSPLSHTPTHLASSLVPPPPLSAVHPTLAATCDGDNDELGRHHLLWLALCRRGPSFQFLLVPCLTYLCISGRQLLALLTVLPQGFLTSRQSRCRYYFAIWAAGNIHPHACYSLILCLILVSRSPRALASARLP